MAPNLLVKAEPAFVRLDKRDFNGKKVVRTDFILENIFAYLLKDQCSFAAISDINQKEKDVFEAMKRIVDAFRQNYSGNVKRLCAEIEAVSEDTVESVLMRVSNELFTEGITWSRIIAFIVFVGEFTIMCECRKLSKSIVDVIYECFSRLVKEKLESWIDDHEDWEGITSLSIVAQQENPLKMSNPGRAKTLLFVAVRMFGTLAHIYNSINQVI